ncbi:hypothetical protein ACIQMR_34340 [Streptomyces sp. NPDC091376]|uniref:hypothetical protein n=1 Tax=Streptomyces sp. NPDC091376 TaxID=3365994 RepID=UPI003809DFB4
MLETGEYGFQSLPDRVDDGLRECRQEGRRHGEDCLGRGVRPSVTGNGVVEAAVAAQRQYSRAEQVSGDFLAVAVEEAVGLAEDEVEFAGVVVIERQ